MNVASKLAAMSATGLAVLAGAVPVGAATPTTYRIGVGAAPPSGQNIEYTDMFPRSGINVHNGDTLDFSVPAGASPDDMHIVAVLKQGVSPAQALADPANALVVPDSDEGGQPLENLPVFAGSNPPPGSGAPGACGNKATPCTYDGSTQLVSGQLGAGADYFVKLALPGAFTGSVAAVDLGHPIKTVSTSVSVVADTAAASAQSDLDSAAASQYQSDTAEATAARAAADHDSVSTNQNGTHNHTVNVGPATQYTEIMENLPHTVHVAPGDTVTYVYKGISDPHTVTFPAGNLSSAVSPFTSPIMCEGQAGDTLAPPTGGPPDFGCAGGPSSVEFAFKAGAMGPSAVRAPAYRMVAADGGVFDFGQADFHGSAGNVRLNSPIVATASTGDQRGYYELAADGGVFTYGGAGFFGSAAGQKLGAPVVSMLVSPDNGGYLLFGADGATYGFGDVPSLPPGSVPANLAAPVVGAAVGPSNNGNGPPGFYVAGADGGVFALNGAPFFGSMGGKHLAAPIVGIAATPDGFGYWLVASDGGVFAFGDANYFGSMGGKPLAAPVAGIATTPSGQGYWLVAKDGGVFSFGDAGFAGSMGSTHLNGSIVGIDTAFTAASSGVLINIPPGNPNAFPSRTSYTFNFPDAGTYAYQCEFHEMMTGTVVVG
ncbi:MAG TPA: hypothetical protein VFP54_00295 [Acidimicrobiales bacterium]|nr:hypothetical protein [Acidimicrobiales bacterium]